MHLVFLDLVPLLLSWEGRLPHEAPEVPPGAAEMLETVFADFRIAGIGDSAHTGVALRRALEDVELDAFFDFIGTAAEFGPAISPRVVRRLSRLLGFDRDQVVVVTARAELAETLQRARLAVVHVEGPEGVAVIPEALEALFSGYFSP
ncbi:MAG: Haloacid dehalogenase-like hydrolase [Acidobacteria bacterium]|nr:Haloacid dehalogenase-like hydrolase [Acidobacteriota bacterium]